MTAADDLVVLLRRENRRWKALALAAWAAAAFMTFAWFVGERREHHRAEQRLDELQRILAESDRAFAEAEAAAAAALAEAKAGSAPASTTDPAPAAAP